MVPRPGRGRLHPGVAVATAVALGIPGLGEQPTRPSLREVRPCHRSSFEQLGMRTSTGKVDGAGRLVCVVDAIDEEKVTADVAFPVARP